MSATVAFCHVCANRARIVADSPRKRAMVALVCLDTLAADALADGVTVLPKIVAKLPERGIVWFQLAFGITIFCTKHHFVGGL